MIDVFWNLQTSNCLFFLELCSLVLTPLRDRVWIICEMKLGSKRYKTKTNWGPRVWMGISWYIMEQNEESDVEWIIPSKATLVVFFTRHVLNISHPIGVRKFDQDLHDRITHHSSSFLTPKSSCQKWDPRWHQHLVVEHLSSLIQMRRTSEHVFWVDHIEAYVLKGDQWVMCSFCKRTVTFRKPFSQHI